MRRKCDDERAKQVAEPAARRGVEHARRAPNELAAGYSVKNAERSAKPVETVPRAPRAPPIKLQGVAPCMRNESLINKAAIRSVEQAKRDE